MRKPLPLPALILAMPFSYAVEAEDSRQLVELPEMMQTHMLERMQGGEGGYMMGRHMPEGMRAIGQNVHRSASRFALTAQEGDLSAAYKALVPVTATCVACHAGYRIR